MSGKQRRSSILKLPKNRSPFVEIDEPVEDNVSSRSMRRVSFASSNFVKPFVADPDKNTIWDTTYEEEIHHTTDSTQSSQEQVSNSGSKVDSTFFNSTKNLVDMELTKCAAFEGNENIPPQRISIVDYAKKLSANTPVPLYALHPQQSNCGNLTMLYPETMEFTCTLPHLPLCTENMSELKSDMELTCQISTANLCKKEITKTEEALVSDMEITCPIPVKGEENAVNQPILNQNMEFTCQSVKTDCSSIVNDRNSTKFFDSENDFHISVNKEKSQGESMEFTCQFPKSNVASAVNACNSSQFNNLENFVNIPNNNHERSEAETMELTSQFPKSNLAGVCNDSKLNKSKNISAIFTDNSNKSQLEPMDFTCQIQKINSKFDDTENTNQNNNESMEFTCHVLKTSTVSINNKTDVNDKTLENVESNDKRSNRPEIISSNEPNIDNYQLNLSKEIPNRNETISSNNQLSTSETCPMEISYINSTASSLSKSSKIPIKSTNNHFDNIENSANAISHHDSDKENRLELPNETNKLEECTIRAEDMELELTCENSTIEGYLPEVKNSSSFRKTPELSFHINLTNISSGVDDTQQLIHCTYTKCGPDFFNLSRFANSDVKLNKEETMNNITVPNVNESNFNKTEVEEAKSFSDADVSHVDFGKNKLAAVNDTYVLRGKNVKIKSEEESVNNTQLTNETLKDDSNASSLGIVDMDQMDDIGEIKSEASKETDFQKRFASLNGKEYDIKIKKVNLKPLLDKIEKQRAEIREYLENFELKPINIPTEFTLPEELQRQIREREARKASEVEECIELSLEEKIKKQQERCGNCWKLENIEGNFYTFSTLFGTLVFKVEVDSASGVVTDVKTENELADDSEPVALYLMKIFLEKLDKDHLKSAIGKSHDILSLLDYVRMTMLDLDELKNGLEYYHSHIITLDANFMATFRMTSVKATISCEISVDVSDIEHIDLDDITILNKVGTVNENVFKNLIKRCSKGLDFFEEFMSCIKDYVKMEEKKKGW